MGRYPWAEMLLFQALFTIAFYPTRNRLYRVAVFAAMAYVVAKIYSTPEVTNPLFTGYYLGFRIALHFAFAAYVMCAEGSFPDHWRRVRDEVQGEANASGLDNLPSNFPVTKKLWWMIDLSTSFRMVGWVQEPRDCLPPPPPPSRSTFLWKSLLTLILSVVMQDLTNLFPRSPAFESGPETTIGELPVLRRLPYVLAFGCKVVVGIYYMQSILGLISVGLGGSSPSLWPNMTGRWGDAYTVRRFWGRTWHQQLRPTVAGFGKLVANKFLKFPRGTNRSSYTQLYVAFFLSAVMHFCGEFTFEKRIVFYSFKFFFLQALAITFEDFVIYLTKRLLPQGGTSLKTGGIDETWAGTVVRITGYCWVTWWFCLSLPVWIDEANDLWFGLVGESQIARFFMLAQK